MLDLDADHRRHAIFEQVIAELKSAGLARTNPAGNCMANAVWLALAVMAHNLDRAVGLLAADDLARDCGDPAPQGCHRPRPLRAQRGAAPPEDAIGGR